MYALIETGGKQYRVEPGDVIDVELLPDSEESVSFDRVLMVADEGNVKLGSPVVDGAVVKGSIVESVRGPKLRVFKMKRRKGYRRTNGHRQNYTRVRIDDIQA
ncbi:MAG: 50S ribosomal protein L21 [Acidobacteriota bacterium]